MNKYQTIALVLACITVGSITMTHPVMAADDTKQSYKTATLSQAIPEEVKPDTRAQQLQAYLKSKDSPMAGAADHFVKEADRLGLDWKLVAAIAGNESYFGKYIPYNSYNGWGWAVWTGMSYGAAFANWEEGITEVSEGLKANYINQGLTTLEQIGRKYAADWGWSFKVQHFMDEIENFDPYAGKESHLLALSL